MAKLDLNRLRQKSARITAEREDRKANRNFWRPKTGKNIVRIFSFDSAVTGQPEIEREIRTHGYGRQTAKCERSPAPTGEERKVCPLCEEAETIAREESKDAAKNLWSKRKVVINVLPIMEGGKIIPEGERKMSTWEAPNTAWEAVTAAMDEVDDPNSLFGCAGQDFRVNYDKDMDPTRMYSCAFLAPSKEKGYGLVLPTSVEADLRDLYAIDKYSPNWWLEKPAAVSSVKTKGADLSDSEDAAPPADDDQDAPFVPDAKEDAVAAGTEEDENAPALPKGWRRKKNPKGGFYYIGPDGERQTEAPVEKKRGGKRAAATSAAPVED